MDFTLFEVIFAFLMFAVIMIAVNVAIFKWFRRSEVSASLRRMMGMMTRVGLDPEIAIDPNPRIRATMKEVRCRCDGCPRKDFCDEWLAGEVEGPNTFCLNASTFRVFMETTQKPILEMNVLIVEDDQHMRMIIRNVVMALGVNDVMEASDGAAALEELKVSRADLVLCDMRMKPMGGLEFVKRLRSDPDNPYRFVPVIMITAYAGLETVKKARDAGVSEFMDKPISADALDKRIQRVLKDTRHFVEAPDFVGPDRRRSKKDEFEGENRREIPPVFLKLRPDQLPSHFPS